MLITSTKDQRQALKATWKAYLATDPKEHRAWHHLLYTLLRNGDVNVSFPAPQTTRTIRIYAQQGRIARCKLWDAAQSIHGQIQMAEYKHNKQLEKGAPAISSHLTLTLVDGLGVQLDEEAIAALLTSCDAILASLKTQPQAA